MKAVVTFAAAVVLMASAALAADLKSGLQPGASVPPFDVEKVAGAVNDGKSVGDNFCYRCMLGNKPVVMVWARTTDESLGKLVKQLDAAIEKNADQKLSSFVNVLGKDADAAKANAKAFAAKHKVENVALVVPQDNANGPDDYAISPEADVTVLIYRGGKVAANHAVAAGKLSDDEIKSIIADTSKILK